MLRADMLTSGKGHDNSRVSSRRVYLSFYLLIQHIGCRPICVSIGVAKFLHVRHVGAVLTGSHERVDRFAQFVKLDILTIYMAVLSLNLAALRGLLIGQRLDLDAQLRDASKSCFEAARLIAVVPTRLSSSVFNKCITME